MTSFDLATFEAAFPPTGVVPGMGAGAYGAGAPTAPPGVDQHITVLNMSGKRATGLWTTEQERSHFTIEPGHILNIHRSGVSPVRTIEISTGGAQPVYSNTRVMPGSTIAIVLNEDGGYSPLAPIGGGGGDDRDNGHATRATGTSTAGYGATYIPGPPANGGGGGYLPPDNGGGNGGGNGPRFTGNNNNGRTGPLSAAYRALTNGTAMSYSPFGWRV
ncbi:hypothetical protein psal_cds_123 [Pandoravirus salinus]|uniref:Uncharacterized protein n=1 Tax=Pandoravirus salinus TaxID=1349410 RepID=S4VTE7_9VIRU|nr:hypothetical protein psal_cds_123 [Pandoravirus salinus]AGO83573.2 hypothetical protein psal_cds_123 [Pandoravirus salinus]